MSNIANEDLTVNFAQVVVPPDAVYGGDVGLDPVKVIAVKSAKIKANNKFVCVNNITYNFATATPCPYSSATYNFVSGTGTILAGSIKLTGTAQALLLEGDTGTCVGGWTLKVSPFTPLACSCNTSIATAGQVKASGI
jgi:hypothetical protein